MAKGKSIAPVVINKKELLLPKMEFLPLNEAGQGFFVKELGGKSLLAYRELITEMEKEAKGNDKEAEDVELSDAQGIELMTVLVHMTACNANGTPYFASKEEADMFADKSLSQLQLAADKAMQVSGMEATQNLKNDLTSSSTDS